MSDNIRIKKGLNIPISGAASRSVNKEVFSDVVAIKPTDFRGIVPKMKVKEGETVKAGTILFADKANPQIQFASPCSGVVEAVVRGEKRKLLSVRIKADKEIDYIKFDIPKELTNENVKDLLLQSGLWCAIKQRPYGIVANPDTTPKSIFISGFNTAPLAADLDFVLQNEFEALQAGINALSKLTAGGVHLSICDGCYANANLNKLQGVIQHKVSGPHPAGNVGVQINHISPIAKGDIIWTVDLHLVATIGKLFTKGIYDASQLVAVVGPAVKTPTYVKGIQGMQISTIKYLADESKGTLRYISGDVLTGENVGIDGFLGFYKNQITVLPEGDYYEMFGWVKPFRSKKFSFSHTYPSFLCSKKRYNMDTNLNGGVRAFVMSDVYGKVLPMDIYPTYLFKAALAKDLEKMEQLGIYEVIEEDIALCEYVCPSKIDIQKIISDGIDLMIKEMA